MGKKKPKHGAYRYPDRKSRWYEERGGGYWLPRKQWSQQVRADKAPQRKRLSSRQRSGKPIPKTKQFGGKTYGKPSSHKDKSSAVKKAKGHRNKGGNARIAKIKDFWGKTKYVVYRRGRK